MADIFGRVDQILNGGLSSDAMFMTWPDLVAVGGGLGLLIQRVQMSYRQEIRRIFEIGPGVIPTPLLQFGITGEPYTSGYVCDTLNPADKELAALCTQRTQPTYYIVGRPQGQLRIGKFVGPNVIGTCFYRQYGSPCSSNIISMSGKAGCRADDPNAHLMTWTINGVVLDELNLSVTGQEMVFEEDIGAMFAGLNLLIDNQEPNCAALAG